MSTDGAPLDLQARAVDAATAVLRQYWPEGTLPLDVDLLAARMGIEVVLGRPEGDAAVAAVRDTRGARVVLAASLHPSVRSALLTRAIGHLSRAGTPTDSEHVGDEFTRTFGTALRIPEAAVTSLRREGLSWPEIDDRLGVARNAAQDQWRLYSALWQRHRQANLDARTERATAASTGTWRPIPQDPLTRTLRSLKHDLRTRLRGLATLSEPATVSRSGFFGVDDRDADRDGALVTPTVVGAVPFWWSQTAHEISFGVGESTPWVVARDDSGVAVVRSLVDAVVLGRVEIGRAAPGKTYRVWLADGSILENPGSPPLPDKADSWDGPIRWAWASAYLQRHDLLQQVVNAMTRLVGRAGSTEPVGHPVQVDAELSAGVEACLSRASGPFHTDGLTAVAVRRSPEQLLREVRALVDEMNRVPLAEGGGDLGEEADIIMAHMTVRHPELSPRALGALINRWAWTNR